jgi:tetratricopeptide (TPR) repeat protein
VAQHISRKELKHDKIRESFEHGAEAVISHQKLALLVLLTIAVVTGAVLGWRFYQERQTSEASSSLDEAMKIYSARIRAANEPAEPSEVTYVDEKNKYEDAVNRFSATADKYPRTNPGRLARYYAGLCLEHLGRDHQAIEALRKVERGSDKELAGLARFQMAQIDDKMGNTDEATKLYRQMMDQPTVFVPKPLAMLYLANDLSRTNPQEAARVYNQIKKEFPDSQIAEEADRGLEAIGPRS